MPVRAERCVRTLAEPPAGCDGGHRRVAGVGGLHEVAGGAEARCRRSWTSTKPFSVIRSTSSWRNGCPRMRHRYDDSELRCREQDQRLQEVLNEGSIVLARRKTAQDEAHGTGAHRGTVAALSEHWVASPLAVEEV